MSKPQVKISQHSSKITYDTHWDDGTLWDSGINWDTHTITEAGSIPVVSIKVDKPQIVSFINKPTIKING